MTSKSLKLPTGLIATMVLTFQMMTCKTKNWTTSFSSSHMSRSSLTTTSLSSKVMVVFFRRSRWLTTISSLKRQLKSIKSCLESTHCKWLKSTETQIWSSSRCWKNHLRCFCHPTSFWTTISTADQFNHSWLNRWHAKMNIKSEGEFKKVENFQ